MSTKPRATNRPRLTIARFLLDGPVLPLVTDTLRVAEAVRRGLLARFQRHCHRQKYGHANKPYQELFRSPVLSGKAADGRILRDHRHAFYLPAAEGDDPRWLTHVTVVAAGGFGPDELAAVNALRTLKLDDESPDLRVQLVGLGHPQDFRTVLLGKSAVWVSATPFVVTRYPKRRGRKRDRPEDYATPGDFARHVLIEELSRLRETRPDLPAIAAIQPLDGIGRQHLRPLEFHRTRRKAGDDGSRRPHGAFRLEFTEPVRGPVCLGYASHFGLGLFIPVEDAAEVRTR